MARFLGDLAPGFLAFYAFAAGVQASAQLFATTKGRAIASVVCVVLFVVFWFYLSRREPSSPGPGGITQKLTHPKLKHWFYLVGILFFTWAPTMPWLMPRSQLELEQATTLEIQRQVSVLEEKIRLADLLYGQMRHDEDQVEQFSKWPPEVRLLLPPPLPYAGLADKLQKDLRRFSITVPQRATELEAAGPQFSTRARIYQRLEKVEDEEREVVVRFRIKWETYANSGVWTTPMVGYRRSFQYLIIGVYLRTLKDLQPDLRSIGLSNPAIPDDLAATKDVWDADQKRLDQGLPPKLEDSDWVPAELHYLGPPPLR